MTDDTRYCPFCASTNLKECVSDSAPSGRKRWRCRGCKRRTTKPLYSEPQIPPQTKAAELKGHKFFVITSALNDTGIIQDAHETFKQIAAAHGGIYAVIPTVYKNPDLYHQGVSESYKWPEEILPYVLHGNINLSNSIAIRGKTRITHTAINPLSGMNSAGDIKSEIYGHAQVAMEMVATPKNELPKMLHTTGTISRPNYGNSKTAQKAAFHHAVSAVIVELEGSKFWTREVHFDGTGAYDLDRYYTPRGFTEGHRAAGIVYGDTHIQALTPKVEHLIHKVVDGLLQPEKRVAHDLHDQHIGSHHNTGNVIFHLQKAAEGRHSVKDELMLAVDYLSDKPGMYIVDSNHHRHLDQWFNRFDPKKDPINAPFYFELGEMIRADISCGGDGNAFRVFLEKYSPAPVNFVGPDDGFEIRGIDCSQHGDRGPNGSRGGIRGFAKSGHKMIVGHSHTPGIEKGTYQVGVMSPNLDYAKGLSSWGNTHAIIYDNGKRALFHIVKDKLSPSMRPGYWQKLAQRGAA